MGGLPANQTVNGFAVDPQNPKVMYVAMRNGLFQSTDAGGTWKSLGRELKNLATVTINPRRPAELYVATVDGVIFKTTDGGIKWERKN